MGDKFAADSPASAEVKEKVIIQAGRSIRIEEMVVARCLVSVVTGPVPSVDKFVLRKRARLSHIAAAGESGLS